MVKFIIGFIAALILTVPVVTVFLRKIQNKRYLERFEELSKLTGGFAHEIKNPLSIIKINLKLISEDLNEKDPKLSRSLRKISIIQKETDRLSQILDDFLRYTGHTELQPLSADINELVSDMVDFYAPQAQNHSIMIRTSLCPEPLFCKVDIVMLKQVLLNLFLNAQQAMPDGGELMIKTSKRRNDTVIEVNDTGSGIAPERLGKIFDAYYSTNPSGHGLGLSIVRKIIALHKGSISVHSELGKGTSFTITLPSVKEGKQN